MVVSVCSIHLQVEHVILVTPRAGCQGFAFKSLFSGIVSKTGAIVQHKADLEVSHFAPLTWFTADTSEETWESVHVIAGKGLTPRKKTQTPCSGFLPTTCVFSGTMTEVGRSNETTPKVWMHCGLKSVGYCGKDLSKTFAFPELFVTPKMSWKMPNHANTWNHQTATIQQKNIWRIPNHKRDAKRWCIPQISSSDMPFGQQ